jgi:hypothetical protein
MGLWLKTFPWERSPSDGKTSYFGRSQSHSTLSASAVGGLNKRKSPKSWGGPSTISGSCNATQLATSTSLANRSSRLNAVAAGGRLPDESGRMDDPTIREDVRGGLARHWSPDQISGRTHPTNDLDRRISPQMIFDWVEDDEDRDNWKSLSADHVHQRLKERVKELDEEHRRSITFDNGTEFARCDRLKPLEAPQLHS